MTDAPEPAAPEPARRPARKRAPGVATIALGIAILALLVAAWAVLRLQRATRLEQASQRAADTTIATLQKQLADGQQQTRSGNERTNTLASRVDDLRATAQGLDQRLTTLENAYTTLSGQQQSGHDALLINDAEMLLRTGQQRYELFNDTAGALKAYTQAIAVLAQVQNPAYAPVRSAAEAERDELAAAAPPSRQTALDTLSNLRGKVTSLPLISVASSAASSSAPPPAGFWSRIGHAFSGIVTVSRDNDKHGLTTPRFARQTLALDLAQAQEAMLAFDETTYRSALQRADTLLAAQFDARDAGVQEARTEIATLLAQHHTGAPAPQLGGALAQLQALRANTATPAPAASSAAPASSATHGGVKP